MNQNYNTFHLKHFDEDDLQSVIGYWMMHSKCPPGCDCDPNAAFPDDFCPAGEECKQCKCLKKGGSSSQDVEIFTRKHNLSQAVTVTTVCPMRMSSVPTIINASSASVCQQVGNEK